MLYIATQSLEGRRVKIGDIVQNAAVPEAFTGKILGVLVRNGLVQSYTGPNGGFELDEHQLRELKVSEIVTAIDGDGIYNGCVLGFVQCSSVNPCALHHHVGRMRDQLRKVLETTSIQELAADLNAGKVNLRIV